MSDAIDKLWQKAKSLEANRTDLSRWQNGWNLRASNEAAVVHAGELPANFAEAVALFQSMGMTDTASFLEECIKISADEDEYRLQNPNSALLQYKYPLY